jgi:hypothetical protein
VFSQISNIGIGNYGVKKMLPRMIMAAIAINLSFFIVQIAVDIANVLGSAILDTMTNMNENASFTPSLGGIVQEIVGLGTGVGVVFMGVSLAAGSGLAMPLLILLALLLIPAIVGLIAGFLTLVIRSALIPIIAIFAPLAFVAYIFPNGQSLFDKWRKTFTALLILYPLSAIYYGALKFTSLMLISTGGVMEKMVGHILLFAGCFVVLGIALKGNAITGKMFGAIQSGINKVVEPARKVGMGVAGASAAIKFAQFKNRDFSTTPTRKRFDPRRVTDKFTTGVGRTLQGFDQNKVARESALGLAKEDANEKYQDRLLEGYNPNDVNTISDFAIKAAGGDRDKAKVMLDRMSATRKAENLKKSMAVLQGDFARNKADFAVNPTTTPSPDAFLEQRILNATNDSDRDAALHMATQMGRSTVIRNVQSHSSYATDSKLQIATQEAIAANASSLAAKAPDLIKGAGPAFSSVTGEQMVGFSPDTMEQYVQHIETELAAGNAAAAQSLLSAVADVTKNPTLQGKFDGVSGQVLLNRITSSPVLSSNHNTAAAAAAIDTDGKIR